MTAELRSLCQGKVIDGAGRVGELLGSSRESAVYALEDGNGSPAVVKFRKDDGLASGEAPEPSNWLARWRSAQSLEHPHLIRLSSSGSCVLDGTPLLYAVMERADETLAGVLSDRLLSETEAREMLSPALSALGYLHRNGYAHTSLKSSNVMACGEQLKLSCDTAVRAAGRVKRQEDVRALGLLLAGALTRDVPTMDERRGAWVLRGVPEPFHSIVQHCLDPNPDKRWTVDQIEAELNPGSSAPRPPEAELREDVVPAPVQDWSRSLRLPAFRPSRRSLVYASLAALVLIVIVAALRRGNDPKAASSPPSASASIATSPAVPEPQPVTALPPATSQPPAVAARRAPPERRAGGWAVVVATYGARPAAEKRAGSLTRKWPRFRAEVFQPPAERPYHLVVIGRNLSEDEAAALRRRAIASGLPRDTYIRRFPG